jgi:hypothetical protein
VHSDGHIDGAERSDEPSTPHPIEPPEVMESYGEPAAATEALEHSGENELDLDADLTEAEHKRQGGRPPGRTVYAIRAEFFDMIGRAWDRARTKQHPQPSCKAVSYALEALASEPDADVVKMAPGTILRGIKHHMGEQATWDAYVLLRARGLREPQ